VNGPARLAIVVVGAFAVGVAISHFAGPVVREEVEFWVDYAHSDKSIRLGWNPAFHPFGPSHER
jgi:hypothetical protein